MNIDPVVEDPDFMLYLGDAREVVAQLDAASVDAIVTSPPYSDAHEQVEAAPLDDFAEWMRTLLCDLLDVLKPEGGFMLNLGRRFRDGQEHPYVEETLAVAREVGWKRIDTIVWHKLNANARGGPYLHNVHETIFWLAPTTRAYRGYDADTRIGYAPETVARYQRKWVRQTAGKGRHKPEDGRELHPEGAKPTSVFAGYTGAEKGNPHPTPMTLDLACYLVALSCPPGGTVLDPFLGSATTARAARQLHRRCVGVEIDPVWAAVAAEAMAQSELR